MRYFFDMFDVDGWSRDEHGIVCADDLGARRQAVLVLVEMAHEYIPSDGASMNLTVRVRHDAQVAFTVRLAFSTEAGPALADPTVIREHSPAA